MDNQPPPQHPDQHHHLVAQDELLAMRADQLTAMLRGLRDTVAGLDERAQHMEQRAERADQKAMRVAQSNRRAIIALGIVALFVLFGGWLIWQNNKNIGEIRQLQQQGISLRQDTLCPILQAALANDTPAARDRFPAGSAAHDQFIARIKRGVASMDCAPLQQ